MFRNVVFGEYTFFGFKKGSTFREWHYVLSKTKLPYKLRQKLGRSNWLSAERGRRVPEAERTALLPSSLCDIRTISDDIVLTETGLRDAMNVMRTRIPGMHSTTPLFQMPYGVEQAQGSRLRRSPCLFLSLSYIYCSPLSLSLGIF